jgi:enoyl-CoA hydratase/carnithine racemase
MSKNSSKQKVVDTNPEVLVEEVSTDTGKLGLLTLNSEKTLNALSLNMVRMLTEALEAWQDNSDIKAIVLKGSGSKAFCAGGDVHALYRSATSQENGVCVDAEKFFFEEYQLDYLIHTYEKPLVCIGHGIVMGGGLGLLSGASHRVITDTTKLAMPEITIGLFPDVGGTLFLNQVPYNLGLFLALTGSMINAADTLFCHLADFAIELSAVDTLIDELTQINFSEDLDVNHSLVTEAISKLKLDEPRLKPSQVRQNLPVLEAAFQHNSLCLIVDDIRKFDDDNEFLSRAKETMLAGSPLSLIAIYEQLKRHRFTDLQTAFSSELTLATNLVRHPDFAEGVRALLIDKDKSPNWTFAHYSHIPSSVIDGLFTMPWEENPLTPLLN